MTDKYAVNEIVLFIENDSTLYRQMYQPIVKNYAKRVVKGTYNKELAIKGVVGLVNEGIRRYRREFGEAGAREYGLGRGVSMQTKREAARQILSGMREEIQSMVGHLRNIGVKRRKK